jgi:filamentous hemagglutinin
MGEAYVGPDYEISSDGTAWVSKDGLRQFRPPSYKPSLGKTQANFESRPTRGVRWPNNGHLDIEQ